MDQIDDFEMKPLTPGLGFHKRQVSLKEHIAKTGLSGQNVRRSLPTEPPAEMLENSKQRTSKEIIAELHEALKPVKKRQESEALKLTETLPREISDVKNPYKPEVTPIEKINFQIQDKALTEQVGARRGAGDNITQSLTPISVSFASIFLDAAIVLAFALIFLVSLVAVTGVDLVSIVKNSQSEFATQLSLAILYLAVFEMYIIVSRSFFGKSVGEWTFDLQMGSDDQLTQAKYPAQILWRSVFNLLTGIIILPMLSLLAGRDLAAKFTGLQLYRRNI